MNSISLLAIALILSGSIHAIHAQPAPSDQMMANKEIARKFYNDLWFSNKTHNYRDYVADSYIVHDIGERKGITEPAVEQKNIADFFWEHGKFDGEIDYQIAEDNLVATRWIANYTPESIFGKVFLGTSSIPIINVFRIENGKIVEIWNHRHDIDTNQTLKYVFKGLLFGMLLALIPTSYALRFRKRLIQQKKHENHQF